MRGSLSALKLIRFNNRQTTCRPSRLSPHRVSASSGRANPRRGCRLSRSQKREVRLAQTAKRIVLGRFMFGERHDRVHHYRSDTYVIDVGGTVAKFRFAVTASKNATPWFNITEAEIRTLQENETVLLVVWNPIGTGEWCRRLLLFCISPDQLAQNLRDRTGFILDSLIRSTLKKLDKDQEKVPGLRELIVQERILVPKAPPDARNARKTQEHLLQVFSHYSDCLKANANVHDIVAAKRALSELRERLVTLLMTIPTTDRGAAGFVVKHTKSDSVLLNFDESLMAAIELGQEESNSLSQAFGDSVIGVEEELESESTEPIAHPYDPTKSKIDTRAITIDLLTKRILEDEIDLAPPFQRKAGLWTQKQKSQLIESLLIRIPLPAFISTPPTTRGGW